MVHPILSNLEKVHLKQLDPQQHPIEYDHLNNKQIYIYYELIDNIIH